MDKCRICNKRPVIERFQLAVIAEENEKEQKWDSWAATVEGDIFTTCINCTLKSIKESDVLFGLTKKVATLFMRPESEIVDEDFNNEPIEFGE